jgi:hypothetical protein
MDTTMSSLRILSKGQITDLSNGFDLKGIPFSIYVRKKALPFGIDLLINCKLIHDKERGDFPVPVGDWTPAAIVKLSPGTISLDDYDVYWGAGYELNKN